MSGSNGKNASVEKKKAADLSRGRFSKEPVVFNIPARFCNSSITESYGGPKWASARAEGNDFLSINSRGL